MNCLLDGYFYTMKTNGTYPTECKRKARWLCTKRLTKEVIEKFDKYRDETNFNIWYSHPWTESPLLLRKLVVMCWPAYWSSRSWTRGVFLEQLGLISTVFLNVFQQIVGRTTKWWLINELMRLFLSHTFLTIPTSIWLFVQTHRRSLQRVQGYHQELYNGMFRWSIKYVRVNYN